MAAYAVLRAARAKKAGGKDALYISYSQEMTREFVDACAIWARAYALAASEAEEFLFDDRTSEGDRSIQAFRIKFASGFEIIGLSSAPRSLRGKDGLLIIDEAAFVDNLKELLKAGLAFLTWGGQVVVCSTHDGAENEFKQHVAQAEMIRSWLDRDELADELFDMLDAVGKGISFTEIIWDTSEGQWDVKRLDWRDPRWFRFRREDGRTPLLRGDQGDQPLPGGKFIVTAIKAKSGLPIRSGLARIIAWAWMFKAFTQRDWAIFTQTYGQPVRLGKYGPSASPEEKATLFRAVANIAGDCAAIIPESMAIDFVESKSVSASTDLYLKRSDWLDQQVSKAVLGQTATTDAIAGGHAVGQEHRQVQKDIETADAKALSAILNRDLVRVWIDLEFGPQKKYPRLKVGDEDEIELDKLVAAVDKLEPMGLKIPVKWMRDRLRAPEPQPGEPVLERAAAEPVKAVVPPTGGKKPGVVASRPGGTAAAEAPAPALHAVRETGGDEIDALTRRAEKRAADAIDALIDRIRDLVERADTLEDVRNGLLRRTHPSWAALRI